MVDPPNIGIVTRDYSSRRMPLQNQNDGSSRSSSEKQYKSKRVLGNITPIVAETTAQTCALSTPSTRPVEPILAPVESTRSSPSNSTPAKR